MDSTKFQTPSQTVLTMSACVGKNFYIGHTFTSTGSVGFDFDGLRGVFLGVFRGYGEGVLRYKAMVLYSRVEKTKCTKIYVLP